MPTPQLPSPNPEPFQPGSYVTDLGDPAEPPRGAPDHPSVGEPLKYHSNGKAQSDVLTPNGDPAKTMVALGLCVFDPQLDTPKEIAVFEGLLAASDLVAWIGREKHRKTTLLLGLAICAAVGRAFLNFRFTAPSLLRVVFIDYESKTHSLKHRYASICKAMALLPAEEELLRANLQIIEVRRMRQEGKYFPRFPLKDSDKRESQFWRKLVAEHPADLYIIDPMRCFHASDENDSTIEQLMERMRTFFGSSAVIVSHHMRKRSSRPDDFCSLLHGMREWSDGARGSGAIKAHADVIVCQERVSGSEEIVYLGAFMKDGADVEPIPLVETDYESFFFKPSFHVPENLRASYEALKKHSSFLSKSAGAGILQAEVRPTGKSMARSTAFEHVKQLAERGLLVESDGGWQVCL